MIAGVLEVQFYANMARIANDMHDAKRIVGGAMADVEKAVGTAQAALASLGVGLGAGYFVSLIKGTIDAADAMNDLSQKVGIGVAELAKYELASKQSGASMESVAKGIKGLAVNMAEHGDALKKAGITANGADGALQQLADVFAGMPDGMEKSALAVKLFGKAGMDLIPMLNLGSKGLAESAEKSAKYAAAMAVLAPQADKFNDAMVEISISSKVATLTLINQMMPALINISGAMALAAQEGGGLKAAWIGFGGIADSAIQPFRITLRGLGAEVNEFLANIEFARAKITFGSVSETAIKNAQDYRKAAADTWTELAKLEKSGMPSASAIKPPTLDMGEWKKRYAEIMKALGVGTADAAKKGVDEFAALMNRITNKDVGLDVSYWKDLATLHAGFEAGRVTVDEYADAVGRLTMQQKFYTDAEKLAAAAEEAVDARWVAAGEAAAKNTQTVLDGNQALRDSIDEMGLTEDALLALKQRRVDDEIARKQSLLTEIGESEARSYATEKINEEIAALEKRKALLGEAKVIGEQVALWKTVEQAGHDAFMHIGEGGKSVLDRLKLTLQNGLLELLYQMTMKKWIITIQQNVMSSGAGSAGGGGLGGLLGDIGDFFSGGGAAAAAEETAAMSAWASLDGGGYTGDGSRSGGVDGKGGFPAILHPQETVIDHTRGGSSTGDVSISMPVTIDARGADASVVPQIQAGMDQMRREVIASFPALLRREQIKRRVTPW